MPHLSLQYSKNLEEHVDVQALCNRLSAKILSFTNDEGERVFPIGGTRVLAHPAERYTIADGSGDYCFLYVNFRIMAGRPHALVQRIGDELAEYLEELLAPALAKASIGYTFQIDEGQEIYDKKAGNLRELFK